MRDGADFMIIMKSSMRSWDIRNFDNFNNHEIIYEKLGYQKF